jgi:serine/threonine-protein kinase
MGSSVPRTESSGRSIGRYVLFDEIAVGGMATVHLGRLVGPVGFARTVAIKRLHAQFAKDPDFGAMFLDEAHLAARIRHPNVVPTLDVVRTDDELFIVMEYVQGETLSRLIKQALTRGELVPQPIVASVMSGVLHGLHAAHEAKDELGAPLHIVHRDVSPQNVLVGVDGASRLLDFGVAKAAQRMQTTRDGQVKGKVAYMAPEQLVSDTLDRRCDLFAAGVVLWEALAGKRLFEGHSDARVITKIINAEVVPPSSVEPSVSAAFDAICMRALSKRPDDRYATAREMALAIEQASNLAPPSTVGAWVETLAHEKLLSRAARIAEVESRSDVHARGAHAGRDGAEPPIEVVESKTAVTKSEVGASPPQRRPWIAFAIAGLVVAFGGAAVLLALRGPSTNVAPAPSSSIVPGASASAPPRAIEPLAPTVASVVSSTPTVVTPPSASVAVAQTKLRAPVATATVKAPSADRCNPPFTVDSSGIKHPKPECL